MSVEARRAMIVHAVLPLLIEHGAGVTTSQIARAAGIGEGTIFRAFKDKDELFDACTAEALRPDHVLDAIAEIPIDQPLEDRLVEAADALSAHLERMGALMGALHASGRHKRRDPEQRLKDRRGTWKGGRRESMAVMRGAMVELFEPEKDRLRLPARAAGRTVPGPAVRRPPDGVGRRRAHHAPGGRRLPARRRGGRMIPGGGGGMEFMMARRGRRRHASTVPESGLTGPGRHPRAQAGRPAEGLALPAEAREDVGLGHGPRPAEGREADLAGQPDPDDPAGADHAPVRPAADSDRVHREAAARLRRRGDPGQGAPRPTS